MNTLRKIARLFTWPALLVWALLTGGCDRLDAATDSLAERIEGDDDQSAQWCAALEVALVACDVTHYGDDHALAVAAGCTDVALAAAGFDVEADPSGRTALHGALLGSVGLHDPSGFENAVEACT